MQFSWPRNPDAAFRALNPEMETATAVKKPSIERVKIIERENDLLMYYLRLNFISRRFSICLLTFKII